VGKLEEKLRQAEEAIAKTKSNENAAWTRNAEALERIHSLAKERDQVRETLENQYTLGKREDARFKVTYYEPSRYFDGNLVSYRPSKNSVKPMSPK
jgi:hypothetical protein